MELILPAKGSVSSDDLTVLGQAQHEGVFVGITELVKGPHAEAVVAGSIDQF